MLDLGMMSELEALVEDVTTGVIVTGVLQLTELREIFEFEVLVSEAVVFAIEMVCFLERLLPFTLVIALVLVLTIVLSCEF